MLLLYMVYYVVQGSSRIRGVQLQVVRLRCILSPGIIFPVVMFRLIRDCGIKVKEVQWERGRNVMMTVTGQVREKTNMNTVKGSVFLLQ